MVRFPTPQALLVICRPSEVLGNESRLLFRAVIILLYKSQLGHFVLKTYHQVIPLPLSLGCIRYQTAGAGLVEPRM